MESEAEIVGNVFQRKGGRVSHLHTTLWVYFSHEWLKYNET